MNAETEMQTNDGLGGTQRLVVIVPPWAVVLKADNDRAPIHQLKHKALNELDADRIVTVYDEDITQERPKAKPYTIRCDAKAGGWLIQVEGESKVYGPYDGDEREAIEGARVEGATI